MLFLNVIVHPGSQSVNFASGFVACAVLRCSSTSVYIPLLGSLAPRHTSKLKSILKLSISVLSFLCTRASTRVSRASPLIRKSSYLKNFQNSKAKRETIQAGLIFSCKAEHCIAQSYTMCYHIGYEDGE